MILWSIAAVWHSQAHFFGRGFQRKPGRAGEQVGCRHLPWHGSCLSNSPGKLLLIDTFSFAFSPNYCWVFVVFKPPACPLPLWWAGCHFSGSCWLQYRWNFLTHTSHFKVTFIFLQVTSTAWWTPWGPSSQILARLLLNLRIEKMGSGDQSYI